MTRLTNEQKQQLKPLASTVKPGTARRQKKNTTPESLKKKNKTKTEYTMGGRISLLRQAVGMTQEQLAEEFGKNCSHISRIESDDIEPKCWEIEIMCELFATTADYIVRGIKNTPANLDLTPDEKKLVIGLLEKLKNC